MDRLSAGRGSPNAGYAAFVPALSVGSPGTITVKSANGLINFGDGYPDVGPDGGTYNLLQYSVQTSYPLDETAGINSAAYPTKMLNRIGALIGVFVPRAQAGTTTFQPVDGTKGIAPTGIVPSELFYVGSSHVIDVRSAGTLYLGINDNGAADNTGSFSVIVTSP